MDKLKSFFGLELWQSVVAGLLILVIQGGAFIWFKEYFFVILSIIEFFIIFRLMVILFTKKWKDRAKVRELLSDMPKGEKELLKECLSQEQDVSLVWGDSLDVISLLDKKILINKGYTHDYHAQVLVNRDFKPYLRDALSAQRA